jgi:hypothetical protein
MSTVSPDWDDLLRLGCWIPVIFDTPADLPKTLAEAQVLHDCVPGPAYDFVYTRNPPRQYWIKGIKGGVIDWSTDDEAMRFCPSEDPYPTPPGETYNLLTSEGDRLADSASELLDYNHD